MNERSRDCDPLLLSSGKLVRKPVFESFKIDPAQAVSGRFAGIQTAGEQQRELYIFDDRKRRKKLEGLEDESDFFPAQLREPIVTQLRRGLAVKPDLPRRGKIHRACQIEKSRLAAPAAADKRNKLLRGDIQRYGFERTYPSSVAEVIFGNTVKAEKEHLFQDSA
jgi:hypothetical protein